MIFSRDKLINFIVESALTIEHAKANVNVDKTELIFLLSKDIKRAIRCLDEKSRAEVLMKMNELDFKRGQELY